MKTHPSYPLTDANRLLYKRILRAKQKMAKTQDIEQRIALRKRISELSEQIRKTGMAK